MTSLIGEGSFGRVTLVTSSDGTLCARKEFKKFQGYQTENNWMVILQSMDIPIPKVIESSAEGNGSITMEYLPSNLLKLIESRSIDPAKITHFVRDMVKWLEKLHSRNLIHGDIKPENICITNKGTLQIIDYGLMCRDDFQLPDNAPIYTAYYRHPWIFNSQFIKVPFRVAKAFDMWALGVVILEIINGKLPDLFVKTSIMEYLLEFRSTNMEILIETILRGSDIPIRDQVLLATLLKGFLQVDKDKYMSAYEASQVLDIFFRPSEETPQPVTNPPKRKRVDTMAPPKSKVLKSFGNCPPPICVDHVWGSGCQNKENCKFFHPVQ